MLPTTNNINNYGSADWIAQISGHESLIMKLTSFEIPEVNSGITTLGTRSEFTYQGGGDHIVYDTLTLNFLLDENLLNYRKLHQWMRDNVGSADSGQSKQESIFIHILNNKKKFQGVEIEFLYAFPISLGKIEFDTDGATSAVTCTATFAYTAFNFMDTPTIKDL